MKTIEEKIDKLIALGNVAASQGDMNSATLYFGKAAGLCLGELQTLREQMGAERFDTVIRACSVQLPNIKRNAPAR